MYNPDNSIQRISYHVSNYSKALLVTPHSDHTIVINSPYHDLNAVLRTPDDLAAYETVCNNPYHRIELTNDHGEPVALQSNAARHVSVTNLLDREHPVSDIGYALPSQQLS